MGGYAGIDRVAQENIGSPLGRNSMILHTVVLLVAATVHTHKVVGPPRFNRRTFIVGTSLLAAAQSADAISTQRLLNRGGWENDPLFGRHPSSARLASINVGIFGVRVGVFYLTEHSHRAWVRWAGRAFIGGAIVSHARLAACNEGINTRSVGVRNCPWVF